MATAPVLIPASQTPWLSRRWLAAVLIASALSLVGKLTIASRTFGATDALLWEANLQQLRHAGPAALHETGTVLQRNGIPYHSEVFNHPPFMIRLLSMGGWLAEQTGMPWRFWLRVACAVADLISTLLLLAILRETPLPISPVALLLVAASPISLLISGFHGNTDPIMMMLLMLAVYLLVKRVPFPAGMALGLAAGIKIVPMLFAPLLALSLPGRKRAVFVASAIGMFFVASLPLVIEHPRLIWSHVFGYSPQMGIWGISRLVAAFATEAQSHAYAFFAKGALLFGLGGISVWLHRRRPQPPAVLQCGLIAFVLISITPGFGVQYLAWLAPWSCLLRWRQAAVFHSVGALFLMLYYTRAANGFPFYVADSTGAQVWYGSLVFVGLFYWLVICWLTFSILQRGLEFRAIDIFAGTVRGARVGGASVSGEHIVAS